MRFVFTMGVYDMFHFGHLELLRRASELGEYLIVGVVEDEAVRKQKGEDRPLIPFEQRIEIVSALRWVKESHALGSFNPEPLFETFTESGYQWANDELILALGEDQSHLDIASVMEKYKPTKVILPRTPNISTTVITKKLKG